MDIKSSAAVAGSRSSNPEQPSSVHQDTPIEETPPPAYSETYGRVNLSQDGLDTQAKIAIDGRVDIDIDRKSDRLSNLLVPALRSQLNLHRTDGLATPPPGYIPSSFGGLPDQAIPPLNVVIHVVGSRGDVQPFISLGRVLKETYRHRVRLATHPIFRDSVEDNGLEFFNIGGDPAELMAFMVKNPSLMPGTDALRNGDIGRRRKGMYEIIKGCWRSCIEAGDGTGVEASDKHVYNGSRLESDVAIGADIDASPFVADAIIANPPSFAHIHCAEKLGIPLHLMFTMPWSPTQAFPHPLANIKSSNADPSMTNFISYALVEMMTWQGLGDIINRFREKTLGLEPVSLVWAPGMASRLRIPYTYCWSPALIPKPADWGPNILISGFYFLSLAESYRPPQELAAFLDSGPPPIYIGFGSIVVDDPNAMTQLIFAAVKMSGQRALVSKGWGGIGADSLIVPEGVFMLENVPHDWLFRHVSCVVHHGGAGTTAAGIALGKPTVIVPFFGDQTFWGERIAKAGAGPLPIPNKQLTSDNLAAAILEALKPVVQCRAQELGAKISAEKGSDVGAKSFHDSLNIDTLRCSLTPSRAAVWQVKRAAIRLSTFAAVVLGDNGLLDFNDLELYRPREYDCEDGPWDPITGATSALIGTIGSLMMGVADIPIEIFRAMQSRPSEKTTVEEGLTTDKISYNSQAQLVPVQRSSNDNTTSDGMQSNNKTSERSPNQTTESDNYAPTTSARAPDPLLESNLPSDRSQHQLSGRTTHKSKMDLQPSKDPFVQTSLKSSTAGLSHSKSRRAFGDQPNRPISFETALDAGKGVRRMIGTGLKSPMDFTLGLARGFHNAPKLYGDSSVRQTEKITSLQSGLKVAGKEFGYGLYDGISGLVTQPIEGVKQEGVTGLLKGVGKGIGGIVFKPSAAFWSLPGYTFKGIYKELQRQQGSSVQSYIIASRTVQGYNDLRVSSEAERTDVLHRWHALQVELENDKQSLRRRSHSPHGFMKTRHLTFDERKQRAKDRKQSKSAEGIDTGSSVAAQDGQITSFEEPRIGSGEAAYEVAIQNSIHATSTGNPAEDAIIERAIRASVAELQNAAGEGDDTAYERAIQASIIEASQTAPAGCVDEEYRTELERALKLSTTDYHNVKDSGSVDISGEKNDSEVDTGDDDNLKAALEESKIQPSPSLYGEDSDLMEALDQSRHHHKKLDKEKSEEEIIIEYIKRQSLAEAEYERRHLTRPKEFGRENRERRTG